MDDFLPGDIVEFIDDNTQGKVIAVLDKERLSISLEDGLEIPVYKSEIVRCERRGSASKSAVLPEKQGVTGEKGMYLALIRADNDTILNFYLINNSEAYIYFTLYQSVEKDVLASSKGNLKQAEHILIAQYNTAKVGYIPFYTLQIILFDSKAKGIPDPVVFAFRPDRKTLLKKMKVAPLLNKEAVLFHLNRKEPIHVSKDLSSQDQEKIVVRKPDPIIDLHIDKLSANARLMTKNEILQQQLQYFRNQLEKGIAFGYSDMVFIHGIGNFTLRNKIYEELKNNKHVKIFREADNRKYGFGATEVVIARK
jgi:hypothetical protein